MKVSSKVSANYVSQLCSQLLEIYNKEDFKETFPNIQNIIPVNDPSILEKLNDKLINAFHTNDIELVMSIPEIIEHDISSNFEFSGAGKDKRVYEDVYIKYYRQYLVHRNVTSITIDNLRLHKLNIQDENGNNKQSFNIYKCLIFDCDLDDMHYHLCEGEWYQIEKDYIQRLKIELDSAFQENDLFMDCHLKREDEYNNYIASTNNDIICLDNKNIAPAGYSQVEPCDLFNVKNNIAQLIHVKISTRSSTLSHLFNQGLNSVELLRLHDESKNKLKAFLGNEEHHLVIERGNYAVIFGIITAKDRLKKSDNLPIFSRISLARTMNALKLMGIQGSVVFIKDIFDRKGNDGE